MSIVRRILSTVTARSGRRTGTTPAAGRRGVGRRRTQPKRTGIAALRGLLRR